MNNFFRSSIITSIFLMILGGLLIFESEAIIVTISYVIGGVLIALGTLAILRFIRSAASGSTTSLDIVYGIVTDILGTLIIIHPKALASIIPVALGISIVISSASKLQYAFELKNEKNKLWKMTLLVALLSTLCGVVLIFNPFKGSQFITQTIGIFIITYAILDLISTITIRRSVIAIKKSIKSNVSDAIIVSEDKK